MATNSILYKVGEMFGPEVFLPPIKKRIAYKDRLEYFCSEDWSAKRNLVRQRAGGICERCRKKNIKNIHHLSYKNFGDEKLEDLWGLCKECHDKIHWWNKLKK